MNKAASSTSQSQVRWQSIILPLVAGLLHLQVFYLAAFHCIYRVYASIGSQQQQQPAAAAATTSSYTSDEFKNECFLLDRAIFLAYVFDLMCCYLKVIPFSRCNCSSDIIGHHMPTLLMALPLAIPLWSGLCDQFESTSLSILDTQIGSEGRNHFINSYTLASGFAYISSLNEVFMCFQRVEMSLGGITSFRDIPFMKHHFFTSRVAVRAELCYKLCFFWGMSIVACKACCDFDKSLYDAITAPLAYDGTLWRTLLTVYSSPAVLRGALFRAFSIVMYPSMGMRCFKKLKKSFQKEGGQKNVKVA